MTIQEWLGEDNKLPIDIWTKKYQNDNETFDEWLDRISNGNIEIRELIKQKKFLFGGRILASRGLNKNNRKITYSNCYVITPPDDNIESIFECAGKLARTFSYGGGCGIDISKLAPSGAKVNNAAKETSGAVSFMDLYSLTTELIGQNGRRGALMLSIDINHPDSPDFITSKQDLSKITGANISVKLNSEFKKAVENDEDYILRWPCNWDVLHPSAYKDKEYDKLYQITNFDTKETTAYYKKIKAKELWDSIIQCAWNSAEPGVLYWDTILDNDPASVYDKYKAVSTNPCGLNLASH